jgi:hypothetical protein
MHRNRTIGGRHGNNAVSMAILAKLHLGSSLGHLGYQSSHPLFFATLIFLLGNYKRKMNR